MDFLMSAWRTTFGAGDSLVMKTFVVHEGALTSKTLTLFIDLDISYDQLEALIKFHIAREGFQKIYFVNPVDFARTGIETPIEICQQTKQLRAILSYPEIPIHVKVS